MCAPVADRRAVTFAPAALGDVLTCAAVSGAVAIGARATVCASVHLQRSVACAPLRSGDLAGACVVSASERRVILDLAHVHPKAMTCGCGTMLLM